ncbi:uncharacterized protein LOC134291803 [Aedes albopictus]|uniref:Uncharacterized protein n=1 Tax=Aedes albopictus TaxID=7160 RepID=A0ABM2A5U7_AEDAL
MMDNQTTNQISTNDRCENVLGTPAGDPVDIPVSALESPSAETIQLQLEYLQMERSIKLKAIKEREAVELLFARKRYYLLKSKSSFDRSAGGDNSFVDENENMSSSTSDASSEYADSLLVNNQDSLPATVSNVVPTSQQICARQVMPMDLPEFTGDPEDWPVFFSQYKNSTLACGYSNAENLVRLQRCIKGKALEYVRSRLLLPELVPKVIKTMEMLYGRPTVIISSLINKIRLIQPPDMDHLETIIDFGMAIQNLYDHLIAMNQTDHLRNPTLLQELEAKLPGEIKLEWARYKRQHISSLKALNDFMNERVEAACELTFVAPREEFHRSEDISRASNELESNRIKICLICKRQNHNVEDCFEFQSYDVTRRWRLVGEHKLCRCCLGRHSTRVCRYANECGINRCHLLHHPLLHQASLQ